MGKVVATIFGGDIKMMDQQIPPTARADFDNSFGEHGETAKDVSLTLPAQHIPEIILEDNTRGTLGNLCEFPRQSIIVVTIKNAKSGGSTDVCRFLAQFSRVTSESEPRFLYLRSLNKNYDLQYFRLNDPNLLAITFVSKPHCTATYQLEYLSDQLNEKNKRLERIQTTYLQQGKDMGILD